jgi:hypothetical protein
MSKQQFREQEISPAELRFLWRKRQRETDGYHEVNKDADDVKCHHLNLTGVLSNSRKRMETNRPSVTICRNQPADRFALGLSGLLYHA